MCKELIAEIDSGILTITATIDSNRGCYSFSDESMKKRIVEIHNELKGVKGYKHSKVYMYPIDTRYPDDTTVKRFIIEKGNRSPKEISYEYDYEPKAWELKVELKMEMNSRPGPTVKTFLKKTGYEFLDHTLICKKIKTDEQFCFYGE